MKAYKPFILCCLLLLPFSLHAEAGMKTTVNGDIYRGTPFILDIDVDKQVEAFNVSWQGIEITVAADCNDNICRAQLMLPAKYDQQGNFPLSISTRQTSGESISSQENITVHDRDYRKQALTVDPKYVNPSKADAERAARESKISVAAVKTFSAEKKWSLPLSRPRQSAITSEFGVQRVYNGEPRSRHGGVDFRGAVGEEITAIADGTVILANDFYYAGNFVFLDHGQGVISEYMHMSKILVQEGQEVKRGEVIGLVGATGRVTGPHLHFSLAVQGILVDPMDLFMDAQ